MSEIAIASRYAKSLIELAQEKGVLSEVMQDIKLFNEAMSNRDLVLLTKSPIIKADKKQKIFKVLFGDKMSTLTTAFFDIVIRKGREGLLAGISTELIRQFKVIENITTASITTAAGISDDTLSLLKKELKSAMDIGGELELNSLTDPMILGGFIIQLEDKLYDASVKNKLAGFKKEILDNSYIKSL